MSDFPDQVRKVVPGGKERQDSVARGLSEISPGTDIVLIHDGARPLVGQDLIGAVIEETGRSGAVVPAVPCEDTVKKAENGVVVETVDRKLLWAVQTPQGFKREIIFSAYEKAMKAGYYGTDDAQLVEKSGGRVKVIPGGKENIKITRPVDLVLAEAILNKKLRG
jgi:2-C-methyl-D-erythritol 4-phosphate cytidylyltransferase